MLWNIQLHVEKLSIGSKYSINISILASILAKGPEAIFSET